jgi:hypothetical protein
MCVCVCVCVCARARARACVHAQLHFNTCKEIWVKLNNEQWYEHVPKIVKKSHECKVTILWNRQPIELFLAINWTLQSMIINKKHEC